MPHIYTHLRNCLAFVLASNTWLATAQTSNTYQLPNMGEPADQDLSLQQERRIGAAYLRQVRSHLKLVDDPQILEYLNALGTQLLANTNNPGFEFTFFITDDTVINAFAAPGGYIGVNSGLLLAANTEAQLAGVVAHEIAHVVQRHLARAQASAKTSSASTAAAMLAAILLGGSNPQASQAILAAGLAGGQQLQINYTRDHEREADRVGIGIMASAGYNPLGMAEFFHTLDRQYGGANQDLLEFLSTHPLTGERINEAESRALSLKRPEQTSDSLAFQLTRMRLRVFTTQNLPQLCQDLQRRSDATAHTQVEDYGLALCLFQSHHFTEAQRISQNLTQQHPDQLAYNLLLANSYYALDNKSAGQTSFDHLLSLYPQHAPSQYEYALALESVGDYSKAHKLMQQALSSRELQTPEHYRNLARIAEAAGEHSRSLEALAEYHVGSGELRLAISQLERALSALPKTSSDYLRISARLDNLRKDYSAALNE